MSIHCLLACYQLDMRDYQVNLSSTLSIEVSCKTIDSY